MKTNSHFITLCAIIVLSLFTINANATTKQQTRDSVCCNPDSLKVVSRNYPVFCVSWRVSTDSTCKRPYGFEIQWRQFPGTYPWISRTIIYTGGTIINFCDSVSVCGNYQWRVRTICDTIGGILYSDWIYGNKIAMANCIERNLKIPENKQNNQKNKSTISIQAIKLKED